MRMLWFLMVGCVTVATPALGASGGMALADFQSAGRTRLMRADTDGDGRVSKAEWTARRQSAATAPKGDPARMFDRIDANRDGALDRGEIDGLLARRFARMDADHDGMLTAAERQASRGRVAD